MFRDRESQACGPCSGLGVYRQATLALDNLRDPRGKFGQVVYDLEGDFGISREKLRERFGYYFEAFPSVSVK